MNKFTISLIASVALHIIAFVIFLNIKQDFKVFYPQKNESKSFSNIKFVKLSTPKINQIHTQNQNIPKQSPVITQTQEITKPIVLPQIIQNLQTKVVETPTITTISKPKEEPKPIIKEDKPKEEPTSINNFLFSTEKPKELDETTKSYIKLYGEEFYHFEPEVKQYLEANLGKIGSVTQKYLKYPTISIKTRQQGINIVEFMLYPNGDITAPKIISSSTYSALDQNSIRTIQIAYKDYPKPTRPTKIKIYVNYIYHIVY